ncbi:MAG: glycosyltransferase family 2 protein [Bacteroidia bacterium]
MSSQEQHIKPLATVLMPVHNVEKYLHEAIDSILGQTFRDYIFLIINDGSTDNSEEIVLSYADPRIRYVRNEKNIGLVATLNRGLELIDTRYIIRMDSDDISVPERFEILVNYMELHQHVGVFSSALERFGSESAIWTSPLSNDEIKAHLLFGSSIGHAPSIIRTSVLKENQLYFRDVHPHMEDYDLWFRMKDLTDFANTSEVLYKYRVADHNVTVVNRESVIDRKKKIFSWILGSIGIQPTDEELLFHIGFGGEHLKPSREIVKKYRAWLDKLVEANRRTQSFPHEALKKEIEKRWNRLFYFLPDSSFGSIPVYARLSGGLTWAQIVYMSKFTVSKFVFRKGQ